MKNNIKFLLIGLIIGVIIATSSVFGLTGAVQKTLEYNNIKITLNGQEITPTDATGAYVEPFTIDGTTYLPVRAIANALDLDVAWDEATSTVVLGKGSTTSSAEGSVVYDKNGIKITYTGSSSDGMFYDQFDFLIENNSNKSIHVSCYDIYANGFAMSDFTSFGISIDPGKKAAKPLQLQKVELKHAGISNVETFEFEVRTYADGLDDTSTVIFNP